MDSSNRLHELGIEVHPSPETNDHEVRLFADGTDLIERYWSDMMGLDPDDILAEPCRLRGNAELSAITIARCGCGVLGCGSIEIEIRRSEDRVVWSLEEYFGDRSVELSFRMGPYDAEIDRALNDHTWETPDRTAARLLKASVNRESLALNNLRFDWASQIDSDTFTVSLTLQPGPYQLLVHLPWRDESPSEIAKISAELLEQDPSTWPRVAWYPQSPGLGPPSIKGRGWSE
jgi:hypothetical protein